MAAEFDEYTVDLLDDTFRATTELDLTLTEIAEKGGALAPAWNGLSPISGPQFLSLVSAAAVVDVDATVEALETYQAAYSKAWGVYQNYAEIEGASGWENLGNELTEAERELSAASFVWDANVDIANAIRVAKTADFMNKIEDALNQGDFGAAAGLAGEMAKLYGEGAKDYVDAQVSGFFGMGGELAEGTNDIAGAFFDALMSGDEEGNLGTGFAPDSGTSGSPMSEGSQPDMSAQEAAGTSNAESGVEAIEYKNANDASDDVGTANEGEAPADDPAPADDDGPAEDDDLFFVDEGNWKKSEDGKYWINKDTGQWVPVNEDNDVDDNTEKDQQSQSNQTDETEESEETEDEAETEETEAPEDDDADTDGYTPDGDEGQPPITAEQAAAAAAQVSEDRLKLYDESYNGPSPVGDEAQTMADAIEAILMDMVSRPGGVEDDPIPEDADLAGEIWDKEKEFWAPTVNPVSTTEMGGDPVPEPFDPDNPLAPLSGSDAFDFV